MADRFKNLTKPLITSWFQNYDMREVLECLSKGVKGGEKYPPSVRSFCVSLHNTNPRAYEFVREKFSNHLPHPQTIRQWYRNSNLDSKSGISTQSLDALEALAKAMDNPLVISLNFDEMNIHRSMTWCRATNKFIGLIDYGTQDSNEEFTLAKDVIVYMAVGINTNFQQPIGYYFIESLKGNERAKLILHIIEEVTKKGIKIASVTCDGHKANPTMFMHLGVKLELVDGDFKSYFINPFNGEKIYIILDPSHAIKLVRNTLGNCETIYDENDEEISWKYLINLVNFSGKQNIGLAHKMTKRHLEFKDRIMHVRTAVETLSNSTANAIQFLKDNGIKEFANAESTIKFIRMYDKLWDIFNSRRIRSDEIPFKSAINENNVDIIFEFLLKAKKYILSLKIMNKQSGRIVPIVKSVYNTAFRGFILNINSVMSMYKDYVEERHWMHFIATYRLSQDPLEMFFGE